MRKEQDDDLPSALPPILTVDLQLPDPVHETPADEAVVAIDDSPVTPAGEPTATTSIPVATAAVEVVDDSDPLAPAMIVPLPEPAEAAEFSSRPRRELRPARPGRQPRPEGLWPEIVYASTLHIVNLGDSEPVRARKELDARIARGLPGDARFVVVLSRKGGVGQTTIATLLGMALADVRADRVLAIDANPDRGTLADRISSRTAASVRDVLWHAPKLGAYIDLSAQLAHDATGLDVAASDADSTRTDTFDAGGYNVVAGVVGPHYGVVVADVGTGVVHSVTRAALQRADAVVIVSGGGVDEARLASETLTWLEANDFGALASNAVVALNASTQGTDLDKLDDIQKHFASRARAVVVIPYDSELAGSTVVRFEALRPFTRESARQLTAAVIDGIDNEADA